jgi:hypothetical protein
MKLSIKHKGINCVEKQHSRGAFKYLTVYVLEEDCSSRTCSWRKELSPAKIDSVDAEQKILGGKRNGNGLQLLFRRSGLTARHSPHIGMEEHTLDISTVFEWIPAKEIMQTWGRCISGEGAAVHGMYLSLRDVSS